MQFNILVAGFQHETNTFAPTKADYRNFENGEGFPAMCRGRDVLTLAETNIPAGGFIKAAQTRPWALSPVIWAAACPSSFVTRDAYERIAGEIVEAAARLKPDAIYLDLHGAMVAEHVDDGEGELLARLRDVVGPDIPIVASLDLHANVTARMLAKADALAAFRTYPHVDMAETGAHAARLLERLLSGPGKLFMATRRLPFLIPINGQCTLMQPAKGFYDTLAGMEGGDLVSLSFAPGFPAADFPECGPVIWGYGETAEAAEVAVARLYNRMIADEAKWEVPFLSPDEAVQEAMRLAAKASRPVVIADTQDNPGAGGDSNTMGMLKALLRHGATDAAMGLIWDPEAVKLAQRAGVGQMVTLALGGSGIDGDSALKARFKVLNLVDGKCRFDGPMMTGVAADVGQTALLGIDGVKVVVSSGKSQMLDRNLYRMAGVEPEAMGILVNKSSVHFRADFQGIAEAVLVAKAPGPMKADPADLPWRNLMAGMRLKPNGTPFAA